MYYTVNKEYNNMSLLKIIHNALDTILLDPSQAKKPVETIEVPKTIETNEKIEAFKKVEQRKDKSVSKCVDSLEKGYKMSRYQLDNEGYSGLGYYGEEGFLEIDEPTIAEEIENFVPTFKYENEIGYHTELYNELKSKFPEAESEVTTGASRPDIVIGNTAIEVKGPTGSQALNTLTTKCLKYSKYYENVICVLFAPQYTEKNFLEIKEGMARTFPNVSIIVKN